MRVVHVDSAHEWRGSQSQALLTAQEMSLRGHEVSVACRTGGYGFSERDADAA